MSLDTDFILALAIPVFGGVVGLKALREHNKKRALSLLVPAGLMLGFILLVRVLGYDHAPPIYAPPTAQGDEAENGASGPVAVSPNSLAAALLESANKITATSPKMLDENTRLDGAFAGPGKAFTYLFTLPNLSAKQARLGYFNNNIAPSIKKAACISPQLKFFFDNNVPVTYKYRSSNGTDLGSVLISRAACRPKPPKPVEASAPEGIENDLNSLPASSGEPDNNSSNGPGQETTGAPPN